MRRKTWVTIAALMLGGAWMASRAEAASPMCIFGVSKNACDGLLKGGSWIPQACGISKCSTLLGKNVSLRVPLLSTSAGCEEGAALQGELAATIDIDLRTHSPRPLRGSGKGKFTIDNPVTLVSIASGNLFATFGVGTHRQDGCGAGCVKSCETCYDASFDPILGVWTLAAEGFLDGTVHVDPFKNCAIRWSFQGKFTARGDVTGPIPANAFPWGFCGTIDGVLECPKC